MTSPHDRPSVDELLESVREWLERDVMTSQDPRLAFHARVAANIIDIVRRENQFSQDIDTRYDAVLAGLGVHDADELTHKIRSGDFDSRLGEVLNSLRPVIDDKVSVANPRYRD